MKVTYIRKEDYLLPDLYLEKGENYGRLGRYGILRLHFIAQNKQALYETLLMTNKLTHHLLLESRSCENYYKELMENYIRNDERLSEKNGIRLSFENDIVDTNIDIEHIFDEFYTSDISRTKGNTGLGLSIAKEFTEMLGGNISANKLKNRLIIKISFNQ